jgi:hypothetical protein
VGLFFERSAKQEKQDTDEIQTSRRYTPTSDEISGLALQFSHDPSKSCLVQSINQSINQSISLGTDCPNVRVLSAFFRPLSFPSKGFEEGFDLTGTRKMLLLETWHKKCWS